MTSYEIDGSAHPRLAKILAGRGIHSIKKKHVVDLDEVEEAVLLRKAKYYGFEDGVKKAGADAKATDKKRVAKKSTIAKVTTKMDKPDDPPKAE